jgi:hypothetical protein
MRLIKRSVRSARKRFVPSPAPGLALAPLLLVRQPLRAGTLATDAGLPALPTCVVGAPPPRPPGVGRPAPRLGGIRGLAVPPELRRRIPGAVRAAQGAADVAARERITLRSAQLKLLDSRDKLNATAAALRSQLASR